MVSLVKNKGAMIPEIQGSVLQAARLRLKLKPEELGAKACLSKNHIIQLEEGGASSFYSEAHKVTVAKKIGKLLGLEESQFLVHPDGDRVFQNSLPFDAEPVAESVKNNKIEKPVMVAPSQSIVSTDKKADKAVAQLIKQKVTLENIQSGKEYFISRLSLPLPAGAVKWMLLGLVAAGLFVTRNEIIDLLIGQQTPTAAVVPAEPIEPLPEVSQASSVSTGASLPVVVPPLPSEASCPKADPTVSEYRVLEPTKTADFIFVQSKAKQTICVIDLAGKSNMQMMDVGSNYTFTGQAPFTVLTNGISQVSIYFQGRPVRIQGDAIRTIRLLEAK